MKVINLTDLKHEELKSNRTGETFSLSSVVTDYFGFKDIFVHHEILAPGIRSSSPHFHTHAEELIFVLDGYPTAKQGASEKLLRPGDFVGFRPGPPDYHVLENNTETAVRLLVIKSNPPEDQPCFQRMRN